MIEITNYSQRSKELLQQANDLLKQAGKDSFIKPSDEGVIRLVFAGQYSAGKSTIIKNLTGRTDIRTGGGITTEEVQEYDWNGIKIIDTPGIHTEQRPDHDEKSYQAILALDMLVFVVTNELFDYHIAEHFRKLAIDKDKAGEMILVINKMDRTSGGNTAAHRNVIREDIKKVIDPYTPEELHLCFLDSDAYAESLVVRADDPEEADELLAESGYPLFIDTINDFVKQKKVASKLTTDLYQIDKLLDEEIIAAEPELENDKFSAEEEFYRQLRYEMITGKDRLKREIKDLYSDSAMKIRQLGQDAADLLAEGCKQNEVEMSWEKKIDEANGIIDSCQTQAVAVLENGLKELNSSIEGITSSEFAVELAKETLDDFELTSDEVRGNFDEARHQAQSIGDKVVRYAHKSGASANSMKLSDISGSKIHDFVLKAGHMAKFKFKPWQAVKITKGIAIGGHVLGILGVAVSIFGQIKSDVHDDKVRENLKTARQSIISQFNKAGAGLEDAGKTFIEENVTKTLDIEISKANDEITRIRSAIDTKDGFIRSAGKLQKECRNLIRDIHQNFG